READVVERLRRARRVRAVRARPAARAVARLVHVCRGRRVELERLLFGVDFARSLRDAPRALLRDGVAERDVLEAHLAPQGPELDRVGRVGDVGARVEQLEDLL